MIETKAQDNPSKKAREKGMKNNLRWFNNNTKFANQVKQLATAR